MASIGAASIGARTTSVASMPSRMASTTSNLSTTSVTSLASGIHILKARAGSSARKLAESKPVQETHDFLMDEDDGVCQPLAGNVRKIALRALECVNLKTIPRERSNAHSEPESEPPAPNLPQERNTMPITAPVRGIQGGRSSSQGVQGKKSLLGALSRAQSKPKRATSADSADKRMKAKYESLSAVSALPVSSVRVEARNEPVPENEGAKAPVSTDQEEEADAPQTTPSGRRFRMSPIIEDDME